MKTINLFTLLLLVLNLSIQDLQAYKSDVFSETSSVQCLQSDTTKQHQIALDVAFNKEKKWVTFKLLNTNKKFETVLVHRVFPHSPGGYQLVTFYDKNGKELYESDELTYTIDGLSMVFAPGECKTSRLSFTDLHIIPQGVSIHKIKIHCVVYSVVYGENSERYKERYVKDFIFDWE